MSLFSEIALVIVLAAVLGIIASWLRQPPLVGYIFAGLLVGPLGFMHINNLPALNSLAEIGIALLLFMVGLEMNLKELRHIASPAAILAGSGQVIFTFIVGFFISQAMGFPLSSAIFISIALVFSSTIIVVKLLSEKQSLNTLHGRVSIGILLIQDIVAIFILIFMGGLSGDKVSGSSLVFDFIFTIAKVAALVFVVVILSRKFFPKLLNFIGRSPEALFMFSLAWGLGFASLLASKPIGLSLEIGGFLAGLALANSNTHFQIAAKIKPLRDFFALLFFVVLGAQMAVINLGAVAFPAVMLSVFVLIGNPIVLFFVMILLGYRSRTAFLAGLSMAQISEFGMIISMLGEKIGFISNEIVSLITMVGLITITISSYFILYGENIYELIKKPLATFEFRKKFIEEAPAPVGYKDHIILIGAHRVGRGIVAELMELGEKFVVVDFNPQVVRDLVKQNIKAIYGDIADEEIKEQSGLRDAKLVISTSPNFNDSLSLIAYLKKFNQDAKIIITAGNEWEAKELYSKGASYVVLPHFIGGRHLVHMLQKDPSLSNLDELKKNDLDLMKENHSS